MTLRVMSYNIRWGLGTDGRYRLDRIADVIRDSAADLVGLQEIERGSPRSRFLDQPARLARMLGMEVAFGANLRLGSWQFGNALLSRLPIENYRNVSLPVPPGVSPLFAARGREETPWQVARSGETNARLCRPPRFSGTALLRRWSPGLFDRRGVLVAQVGLAGYGGRTLTVLVTHLPLQQDVRLAQAKTILSLLPDVSQATLLLGDFNEGPNGRATRRFLECGLTDLSGDVPTFSSARPVGKIDFILGRGPVRAASMPRVIASPASDHLPVVVDVAISKGDSRVPVCPDLQC
jgi:endonuclease/exonuclease/phosphatase family metal-dependent hydrolase